MFAHTEELSNLWQTFSKETKYEKTFDVMSQKRNNGFRDNTNLCLRTERRQTSWSEDNSINRELFGCPTPTGESPIGETTGNESISKDSDSIGNSPSDFSSSGLSTGPSSTDSGSGGGFSWLWIIIVLLILVVIIAIVVIVCLFSSKKETPKESSGAPSPAPPPPAAAPTAIDGTWPEGET